MKIAACWLISAGCVALYLAFTLLAQQATYTLKPTPKTVAWGYHDAKAAPLLRVKSGDTVEIQTLITSSLKRPEEAVHMMIPKAIFVSAPLPR